MLGNLNQQRRAIDLERIERFAELLRLWLFHIKRIHDDQLAIRELRSQRGTQCTQQLLAGKSVVIGVWLRTMHCAAMPPEWRTNRTHASPPCSLLLPKFLAGSGDQFLILSR